MNGFKRMSWNYFFPCFLEDFLRQWCYLFFIQVINIFSKASLSGKKSLLVFISSNYLNVGNETIFKASCVPQHLFQECGVWEGTPEDCQLKLIFLLHLKPNCWWILGESANSSTLISLLVPRHSFLKPALDKKRQGELGTTQFDSS